MRTEPKRSADVARGARTQLTQAFCVKRNQMNKKIKLATTLLVLSIVGTVAFFSLMILNNTQDKGNEWFKPEIFIISITLTAVVGTLIAITRFKEPKGKKVSLIGILVIYGGIFFGEGSSSKGSSSTTTTKTIHVTRQKITT